MSEPTKVKESAHTPGPWEVRRNERGYCIRSTTHDGAIADVWGNSSNGERDANARRIVACVNACEGIDNEWIEANSGMLQGHDHALERERDHLRERVAELEEALGSARAAIKTMKLFFDLDLKSFLPGLPAIEEGIQNALGQK